MTKPADRAGSSSGTSPNPNGPELGCDGAASALVPTEGGRIKAMRRALRRRRKPPEPPALLNSPKPSLTYRLISYLLVFPVFRFLFRGRIDEFIFTKRSMSNDDIKGFYEMGKE